MYVSKANRNLCIWNHSIKREYLIVNYFTWLKNKSLFKKIFAFLYS